jgi:hypothetical protein
MRRPILSMIGAALLAGPFVLRQFTPYRILELVGLTSRSEYLPTLLQALVFAGAYLLEWAPALAGLWLIYYANRKQV